ncbi:MAG: PPOX class F420-dependent oxidoreductase [Actinomycetota bacterium]
MPTDLDQAKYVSFTTFKKDGTPKPVPVWIVPFDGRYAFTTEAESWKVKRLRNNPAITVEACDVRGRVKPGTTVHHGTADTLDETSAARVSAAVKKKYGIVWYIVIGPAELWRKVRGTSTIPGAVAFDVVD